MQRSRVGGRLLSDNTVQYLIRKFYRLFIYAAIVCRFIRDGGQLADERLSLLIAAGNLLVKPEKELDQIYIMVLTYSLKARFNIDETTRVRDLFHRIIKSIVVLFDTISLPNLAMMLTELKEKIIATLNCLHSILDVPEQENRLIRLLYPSFRDFLLDPTRYLNSTFSINTKDAHRHLFDCCLRIMSIYLRRNMCNLQRPDTRVSDIPKSDVDKSIPLPIQYACRY